MGKQKPKSDSEKKEPSKKHSFANVLSVNFKRIDMPKIPVMKN